MNKKRGSVWKIFCQSIMAQKTKLFNQFMDLEKIIMIMDRFFIVQDILALYYPLHEADVEKGYDILMERVKKAPTNLYKLRKKSGMTQKQLAQYAEVKERTIRAYEQRETEINKAQVNIVRALSLVLGCSIEDLLE